MMEQEHQNKLEQILEEQTRGIGFNNLTVDFLANNNERKITIEDGAVKPLNFAQSED